MKAIQISRNLLVGLSFFMTLVSHTQNSPEPRYAKMTDTVFHVGDLIQHGYYPIYVLRPYPMRFPDENCAADDEKGFLHFLELVEFIKSHPSLILEIGVHTDWRGSAASNLDLSQRRANVVVDCMVREYGIDSTQVKAVGYGREKPRLVYWCNNNYWAYLNDSLSAFCPEPELIELNNDYINQHKANKLLFERLHQFNRRVEVKVVGIRE